ncbi:MAG: YihY family inner membrane protein [Spirochaetales bacterium]|nr:YihY family inner membrane protein [Candidatus Physcosoma equi]
MAGRKTVLQRVGDWFIDYFNILKTTILNIGRDNVAILTSGMVYSSLVAIVPCVTFLSAFLTAFGGFQPFMDVATEWLCSTFGTETGNYVLGLISTFSRNAMSLGVVGLVSFIITGLLLVNKIYNVINLVFRTNSNSSIVKRYLTFLIFLITLTVLVSFSFALSSTMQGLLNQLLGMGGYTRSKTLYLKKLGSNFAIFLILFLMLKFIPKTKIRLDSAISGAFLGTLFLYAATFVFTNIIRTTVKYSVIYGAMASLLFVLLYLYIIWYIVIVVAEMTYIYQFRPDRNTLIGHPITAEKQLSEATDMLVYVARKFMEGKGPSSTAELSLKKGIPLVRVSSYLRDMENFHLVVAVNQQKTSFTLARPADAITAADVIEAVFSAEGGKSSLENARTVGDNLSKEFMKAGKETFNQINLSELVKLS